MFAVASSETESLVDHTESVLVEEDNLGTVPENVKEKLNRLNSIKLLVEINVQKLKKMTISKPMFGNFPKYQTFWRAKFDIYFDADLKMV